MAEGKHCTVVGRLVHDDGRKTPLHHVTVLLYDRDPLTPDDWLARADTDFNGGFELVFDRARAGRFDRPDLELRVLDHPWDVEVEEGRPRPLEVARVKLADDVEAEHVELGDVPVEVWEYLEGELPRLRVEAETCLLHQIKELQIGIAATKDLLELDQESKPQRYADGYVAEFAREALKTALVRGKHELASLLEATTPELDEIQADYHDNLTVLMERREPGSSRSDEHFVDRILNGFNPLVFLRNRADPTRFLIDYDWSDYAHDDEHDRTNVRVELALEGGKLHPTGIEVDLNGATTVATPKDSERWSQAKRIFRASYLTAGETDCHLSRGHLNTEQFAVAAFRHLRRSPVAELLFPHLKEVVLTNHRGASLIFGDEGVVTTNSPLVPESVNRRMVEQLGALDWRGWRPRAPLVSAHRFARVAGLYWELVGEHVDEYLADHAEGIAEHWGEVQRFSDDLVAHAAPFHDQVAPEGWEWYDTSEVADPERERIEVDGVVRAMSPITGLEDLAQAARFAIYHGSFWHAWCHNRQSDDGAELRYASLGLRNGSWGTEDDDRIAPDPGEATLQLFMAQILDSVKYGYVTKNEDGDVPLGLVERLEARRAEFKELGYDIDELRSRTNI